MLLRTPLSEEDIKALKAGDEVQLSGIIHTARDQAYRRALSTGKFPAELEGGVVFHSGPLVKKEGSEWKIIAIGPTTSSRMDSMQGEFVEKFGVRAIIGKGGLDKNAVKGKAVYLAMTGGCAALATRYIKRIVKVEWLDLGTPEAVWSMEVEKLPVLVAIDSTGKSLYER